MTPAMKRLRELRNRQSTERGRMAELSLVDELSDEQRSELDTIERATPDLERQLRAATVALEEEERDAETRQNTEPDAEQRERVELRSRASLTEYLLARAQGRLVSGAEGELCAAAGVSGIPLELWDVPRETRAVTEGARDGRREPGPHPTRRLRQQHRHAARHCHAACRVRHLRDGDDHGLAVRRRQGQERRNRRDGRGDDRNHGDPEAGFGAARTDHRGRRRGRRAANFESALRENLSLALSDELDDQAINGDGQAPNLTGMFQRLTDPSAPAAGVVTFDGFVSAFAGGIDGLWANTVKDVAIVAGVDTYKLSAQTFRDRVIDTGQRGGVSLGDTSFADYAMGKFGGWWTNKRMPDTASNVQQALLYRKGRSAAGASGGDADGRLSALGRGQRLTTSTAGARRASGLSPCTCCSAM